MDLESELKLISLISQLMPSIDDADYDEESKGLSLIIQIISLVSSLDLESQPKPESHFMSLIIQIKSLFNSMDLDSQPKPLSKLISRFTELVNLPTNPDADDLASLIDEAFALEPEPEVMSLIYQILSLVSDMNSKNVIFLCPQAQVRVGEDNILYIDEDVQLGSKYNKWECLNMDGKKVKGSSSYFFCEACKGHNHKRCEKARDEIKHPLHPKHSLKLFFLDNYPIERKCYCCDEDLSEFIYCCLACDYAMNIACVEKTQVLSIDHPKRHEHPLTLFSRTTSLICDACGLVDSTCSIYICPPCGFVVHRRCIDLPHVIRISRHPIVSLLLLPLTKKIGLVVFVAKRSTMITGDIIASRTTVLMWFILNVPHRRMCGMA